MRRREFITLARRRGARGRSPRARSSRADAADRRADGAMPRATRKDRPASRRSGRDSRSSGGRRAATSGSTLAGRRRRRGVDTAIREGTRRAAARPHSFAKHTHHGGAAATNAHHPHHFRDRCRSGRQRLRRELSAAGRQRHRFHQYRADDGRQVAGAAQGDCAARQPGRLPVQPGNGAICRILPEPLQSRRCVLRRGGDRRTCSRHVRARIRRCRTGTRAEWRPCRDAGYLHDRPSRGDHIAGGSLPSPCRLSVPFLH